MSARTVPWFLCAVAACSTEVQLGDTHRDAVTTTAGSGGIAGGAGAAGSGGASGGGDDAAAGAPMSDAAGDVSTTDGTGGTADASLNDAGYDTSSTGGSGGTSARDGAAGTGASDGGHPDADGGRASACEVVLHLINRESWIAFDSDRDNFHRNIYAMHPDGSGLTQLTEGTNIDREPSFSSDGAEISYTSNVAGVPQVFLLDLATRKSVQLTNRPEGAQQSTFSPDREWVAFFSGAGIYLIRTDGTGEKLVAKPDPAPRYLDTWPSFSASGAELLISNNGSIRALRIDGTGSRFIVNATTTTVTMPAASPSGTDVAYSVVCGGNWPQTQEIWTTPLAVATDFCSAPARRLTPTDSIVSARPTWGAEEVLAYHRVNRTTGVGVIALISRTDERPCVVTSPANDSRNPSWSQNGLVRR